MVSQARIACTVLSEWAHIGTNHLLARAATARSVIQAGDQVITSSRVPQMDLQLLQDRLTTPSCRAESAEADRIEKGLAFICEPAGEVRAPALSPSPRCARLTSPCLALPAELSLPALHIAQLPVAAAASPAQRQQQQQLPVPATKKVQLACSLCGSRQRRSQQAGSQPIVFVCPSSSSSSNNNNTTTVAFLRTIVGGAGSRLSEQDDRFGCRLRVGAAEG